MKYKLLALLLLAGSSMFGATRFFFGVGFGGYRYVPPAPVVVYTPPPAPYAAYVRPVARPGYTWVSGYWYPVGPRWVWHAGYWTRPPYARAYWVAPRYHGHRYYPGHWRRR